MPLIEEVVHHSAALEPLDGDDAELHEDASSSKVNLDAAVAEIEAREAEHGWQTLVEGTDGDRPAVDEDGNVLSVFGEQSLHNYPDIHADWGDVRHGPLAARRPTANPYDANAGGWNTEYRAQLEHAMDMVRDSREVMKNLRELRRKKKEEDEEGVHHTYVKGQTAKEASEQWERERAERVERDKSRRLAKMEADARAAARAAEEKAGEIVGVKPLPEWIVKAGKKDGSSSEFDLAAVHREWIEALGARDSPTRTRTGRSAMNQDADEDARCDSDRGALEEATEPPATPPSEKEKAESKRMGAETARSEFEVDDSNERDFFRELSSLSPHRRAQSSRTEERDFWNEDVYGGDVNDELAQFERQMSEMCNLEISSIKRVAVAED